MVTAGVFDPAPETEDTQAVQVTGGPDDATDCSNDERPSRWIWAEPVWV